MTVVVVLWTKAKMHDLDLKTGRGQHVSMRCTEQSVPDGSEKKCDVLPELFTENSFTRRMIRLINFAK